MIKNTHLYNIVFSRDDYMEVLMKLENHQDSIYPVKAKKVISNLDHATSMEDRNPYNEVLDELYNVMDVLHIERVDRPVQSAFLNVREILDYISEIHQKLDDINEIKRGIKKDYARQRRRYHIYPSIVLASEAFRANGDFHIFSGNNLCVNHGRCVIAGVSTANRVFYDRFAKVAVCISAAYALVDGIGEISSNEMYILSDFQENTGHSCILADGYTLLICNVKVFNDIVQNTFGNLAVLAGTAGCNGVFYVFGKMFICFDTEFFDDICKSAYFYFTHFGKLPSFFYF